MSIISGFNTISDSLTQISVAKAPLLVPKPGSLIIVPNTLSPTENLLTSFPTSVITPEKSLPTPLGNKDDLDSNQRLGFLNFVIKDRNLRGFAPSKVL